MPVSVRIPLIRQCRNLRDVLTWRPHEDRRRGQRHVTRAQSERPRDVVMFSRVKQPKVAVIPLENDGNNITSTNVIVDGSAFTVPGKTVTSEYFHMEPEDRKRGLGKGLQMRMCNYYSDERWNPENPIYFVALVHPDMQDALFMYDVTGFDCYLASYEGSNFTFRKAVFGPELLFELREVLYGWA